MTDKSTSLSGSDDFIHHSRITLIQGLILAVCVLIGMIDAFEIVLAAYTAPAITRDWLVPSQEMGLLLSASLLGMTLGAMFLSPLADVYGRRLLIGAMLILAGVATHTVSHADSVGQVIALRFVAGLALGPLLSTVPTLISEFSPGRHRTLILATYYCLSSIGSALCGIVAAAVLPEYGWRPIYFATGIASLITAVIVYLTVPESMSFVAKRDRNRALERINRTLAYLRQPPIDHFSQTLETSTQESASVFSLLTPRRRGVTLLSWATFFLTFTTVYFINSWTPQALVNFGLSQDDAIYAAVGNTIGQMLGLVLLGWLARWWRLSGIISLALAFGALVMSALGGALMTMDGIPFIVIWILLFLIGMTANAGFLNLYTVVLEVYPAQVRSTGLGWCIGLGRGGAVISPTAAGMMIGLGMSIPTLFFSFATPILVAALCVRLIKMQELP